jgi:hypothetical protein
MQDVGPDRESSKASFRTFIAAISLLFVFGGCGPASQGPETHPVTGKVTYLDEPAANVTLTFFAEGEGVDSQAVTDDEGNFDVYTYYDMGKSQKRGMVAGEYRVSAVKLDRESIKSSLQPPKDLLPKKYATPDNSQLTATVVADDANTLSFDLK